MWLGRFLCHFYKMIRGSECLKRGLWVAAKVTVRTLASTVADDPAVPGDRVLRAEKPALGVEGRKGQAVGLWHQDVLGLVHEFDLFYPQCFRVEQALDKPVDAR